MDALPESIDRTIRTEKITGQFSNVSESADMKTVLFSSPHVTSRTSWGLLVMRITFGLGMAIGHGLPKLQKFSDIQSSFADPLGIGSTASLASAVLVEVLFGLLFALGLLTRVSTLPLIFTMGVAAFLVHGADPLFAKGPSKEMALLYLLAYVAVLITGPGKYSIDEHIK